MNAHHNLDLRQQIALVRRFGESPVLMFAAPALALTCVASLIVFNMMADGPVRIVVLFLGGVGGMLALAIAVNLRGMRRAAQATRKGVRVRGTLDLHVDRSDSDHVLITGTMVHGAMTWTLHFSRPMGWEPQSGSWPCELVFLSGQRLPALAQLPEGLLFPTARSRRGPARIIHDPSAATANPSAGT